MRKPKFEIGDVVKLVSGGPEMAIKNLAPETEYYAQWFAGKKLEQGRFPEAALTLVRKVGT
jgi:uncharacterized protein YodC (DUF2158 family)